MFEKHKIPNFMEICPMDIDLSHADGLIDTTKLIVVLCDFANEP